MAEQDGDRTRAQGPRGLHVLPLAHHQCRPPCQAGDGGPAHQRQDQDDAKRRVLRPVSIQTETREIRRGHDDQQGQQRQGDHEVRDAHEHRIEPAAEIPSRESQHRADKRGHQRRGQPDEQRYSGALQEAKQEIAAELVGTDGVSPARARQPGQEIDGFGPQPERRLGQREGQRHEAQDRQHGTGRQPRDRGGEIASRLRGGGRGAASRQPCPDPNARIHPGVREIGGQIAQQHEQGREEQAHEGQRL